MRESLRARLLFWHVATGAAIILAFGASVCVLVWHTRMVAIDATLAAHAAQLEDAVLPTGEGQVDLILGPGLRQPDAAGVYHFLWTRDGVLNDRSSTDLLTPRPMGEATRSAERSPPPWPRVASSRCSASLIPRCRRRDLLVPRCGSWRRTQTATRYSWPPWCAV